jgi:hypothetical protein
VGHRPAASADGCGGRGDVELGASDAKFFDQFFSSMRKHLIDENE